MKNKILMKKPVVLLLLSNLLQTAAAFLSPNLIIAAKSRWHVLHHDHFAPQDQPWFEEGRQKQGVNQDSHSSQHQSSVRPASVNGSDKRHDWQDSLEAFAADVQKVFDLRSSYYDPAVPKIHHRPQSFTNTWTLTEWKRHSSRWRYWDHITSLPKSRILNRISPQLTVLILWSVFVCWLYDQQKSLSVGVLQHMTNHMLSMTPLSLLSTFVAALLTLRSNQGLSRLNEGRLALGKVVLYTRDMAQLIAANVYPKDKYLGLKAARHTALFAWLLKGFLRGEEINGDDRDIIQVMLPFDNPKPNQQEPRSPTSAKTPKNNDSSPATLSPDATYILAQRKRPVAVVTRLRQIFALLLQRGQLTTSEASRLDHTVQQLNHCIMIAERIQASPIPPVYTTHTSRLLLFYLWQLPLALRGSQLLDSIGTIITTAVVGYAMFGLDEISHMTEEPFRLMPLWHLAKNSLRDCGDALTCEPPPLLLVEKYDPSLEDSLDDEILALQEEDYFP